MSRFAVFCGMVGVLLASLPVAGAPPNIVYINADDLGVMDVGYNSERYHTPNIDRLAAEGMVFTEAYAPAANCAPSRACCMSGQYTPRHGVYTVGRSDRGKARYRRLIPIENTAHLGDEVVTVAEALRAGGYGTIHLGKWHLGSDPRTQGFEVNIGGGAAGGPSGGGYFSPFPSGPMQSYSDPYPKGTHRCDIFADQAVRFMRTHRDEPFFIHMAYYSVHTRLEPVPEYIDRYQDKKVNATYASMIEKMDQSIGKILGELQQLGLSEKTLVLFTSDNGGVRKTSDQAPYRSGKGSYFEGGIRVPLVMRWPGRVPQGSRSDTPVSGIDFLPTFLDAAGLTPPSGQRLDGVSLLPLLTGRGPLPERVLFWHFPVYLQAYAGKEDDAHDPLFRTRPGTVMRLGRWKLHEYFEDGRLELYDLEADLSERKNLAEQMPEKTKALHALMLKWREETRAPVPMEPEPKFDP